MLPYSTYTKLKKPSKPTSKASLRAGDQGHGHRGGGPGRRGTAGSELCSHRAAHAGSARFPVNRLYFDKKFKNTDFKSGFLKVNDFNQWKYKIISYLWTIILSRISYGSKEREKARDGH